MQESGNSVILMALAIIAIIGACLIFIYGRQTLGPTPTSAPPAATSGGAAAVAVPFEELVAGTHSSVSARVDYLITSASELNQLWTMLGTTDKMPSVDFTNDEIIAVFAGQKPTSGYSIAVSKIEDDGAARTVIVDLTQPGSGCATATALTDPYQIVQVPKTSLPLTHEDQTSTANCP
ncbi:MAG TPA: protease complex subunit PrcB family protein [Candidatus Paceibacterota bacterium]|nr:protease complex subunit PrcB family protein [Candidatus Paceibacterota bacterium]